MATEEIVLKVIVESGKADKDLQKVGNTAKSTAGETTLISKAMGKVDKAMKIVGATSRLMFGTIKAGIISTGIGALVVIVGSLVAWFLKSKAGAEFLSKAFAAVGATIKVLIDRIAAIGGAIAKVFSGDFAGAANDAKKALSGIGDEIAAEASAAWALQEAANALITSNRELEVQAAKNIEKLNELKDIAGDTKLAEEDRIAAASQAHELEMEVMRLKVANATEGLRIKREEYAMGEATVEQLRELADLEIALYNIKAEASGKEKELVKTIEGIKEYGRGKAKAGADAEKQRAKELADTIRKIVEDTNKLQEGAYLDTIKRTEGAEAAELLAVELATTAKLEASELVLKNSKAKGKEREALEMAQFQYSITLFAEEAIAKKAITDKYDAEQSKLDDEKDERYKASLAKTLEITTENTTALIDDLGKRALAEIENERAKELASVEITENSGKEKDAINAKYNIKRQAQIKATSDLERKLSIGDLAAVSSVLGQAAENHTEGTKSWKMIKIAEARINSFVAASSAYTAMAGIPIVGPALGVIAAGLALKAGQNQINQIKSTEIPEPEKLNRGGLIDGPGTSTSDSINARLSKGEVVINANSAKMFRKSLSNINVAGGGVAFARGGATDTAPLPDSSLDKEPLKAFVITDDLTTSQQKLADIRRRSNI